MHPFRRPGLARYFHTGSAVLVVIVWWVAQGSAEGARGPRAAHQAPVAAKDEEEPVRLLELARAVDTREAKRIRARVHTILQERNPVAEPEKLADLAQRMAKVLPEAVRSPVQLAEVLGPPRNTSRQILYRRYVEQWRYETPLPLCAVFAALRGQEPRLQSVHVVGLEKK